MTKFRDWSAKKIIDFTINFIASPEYSDNIKTVIFLGEQTWRKAVEEELKKR